MTTSKSHEPDTTETPQIVVTEAMIEAGLEVIEKWSNDYGVDDVPFPRYLATELLLCVLRPSL